MPNKPSNLYLLNSNEMSRAARGDFTFWTFSSFLMIFCFSFVFCVCVSSSVFDLLNLSWNWMNLNCWTMNWMNYNCVNVYDLQPLLFCSLNELMFVRRLKFAHSMHRLPLTLYLVLVLRCVVYAHLDYHPNVFFASILLCVFCFHHGFVERPDLCCRGVGDHYFGYEYEFN